MREAWRKRDVGSRPAKCPSGRFVVVQNEVVARAHNAPITLGGPNSARRGAGAARGGAEDGQLPVDAATL